MKLRFDNEAARLAHPSSVNRIPNYMFDTFFFRKISEQLLTLMDAMPKTIRAILCDKDSAVFKDETLGDEIFTALAFSSLVAPDAFFMELISLIPTSPKAALGAAILAERFNLAEKIMVAHPQAFDDRLFQECYVRAAGSGKLPAMDFLMRYFLQDLAARALAGNEPSLHLGYFVMACQIARNYGQLTAIKHMLKTPLVFALFEQDDFTQENYHAACAVINAKYFVPEDISQYENLIIVPFLLVHEALMALYEQAAVSAPNADLILAEAADPRLYFYMLRALIRLNNSAVLKDIVLLLRVKAVRDLLSVTTGLASYLDLGPAGLRDFAVDIENESVVELLNSIPIETPVANEEVRDTDDISAPSDLDSEVEDTCISVDSDSDSEDDAISVYYDAVEEISVVPYSMFARSLVTRSAVNGPEVFEAEDSNGLEHC